MMEFHVIKLQSYYFFPANYVFQTVDFPTTVRVCYCLSLIYSFLIFIVAFMDLAPFSNPKIKVIKHLMMQL